MPNPDEINWQIAESENARATRTPAEIERDNHAHALTLAEAQLTSEKKKNEQLVRGELERLTTKIWMRN